MAPSGPWARRATASPYRSIDRYADDLALVARNVGDGLAIFIRIPDMTLIDPSGERKQPAEVQLMPTEIRPTASYA